MNTKNIDTKDGLIQTLSDLLEELRSPLANLRAAAENLSTHHDISTVMRNAFENIILQESTILSNAFQTLADTSKQALQSTLHHTTLSSTVLLNSLGTATNLDGVAAANSPSCNIRADKNSLLLLLECMINRIKEERNTSTVSCEVNLAGTHVYLDLVWKGNPFSAAEIEAWQNKKLLVSHHQSIAAILKEHDSDIWSSRHSTDGKSLLRIPLPVSSPIVTDTSQE